MTLGGFSPDFHWTPLGGPEPRNVRRRTIRPEKTSVTVISHVGIPLCQRRVASGIGRNPGHQGLRMGILFTAQPSQPGGARQCYCPASWPRNRAAADQVLGDRTSTGRESEKAARRDPPRQRSPGRLVLPRAEGAAEAQGRRREPRG